MKRAPHRRLRSILIVLLWALLAAIRVYPRFWNMRIQSTDPIRLLVGELVNGSIGSLVIAITFQAFTRG